MSITVSICDDEAKQIRFLRSLLAKWAAEKPFALEILEYESAEGFLFDYEDNPCDLLLLDIEMQGVDGMTLAKNLRQKGDMLPIIFITGFSEYISEGYDVEALHYLLKPVDEKQLFAVLDRYVEKRAVKSEEILVTGEEKSLHIPVSRIVYIEAFGRKTQITLMDGSVFSCDMGIGAFAQKNMEGFVQCHRSYLVNLRYVKAIGKVSLRLDGGTEIPLSRRLYQRVNQEFIAYYTGSSIS